ncbi:response regulator transcription factor [Pseudophaeobacter flagellatus]|uniref:response regulator transcription factor n=1 Tax=Pseudophaeobacter flagellatus TaxID=2899119 RepID=UPI001E33037B|nr:response regulator transcription factor [Pseudophaeobacter flagellatus]MCD9146308.1 response regulator transcription factor [Pseudophaeobacter flagellatus]
MAISRLLVVDDDAETRSMLTQFLQQNGFIALAASSEAEIRSHMRAGRIDLILLDVMLGDENGVEICARLRAEQDVPIILVSALSQDHQRMAGYEVGADDYIAKPFNPDLLLARLRAVLQRASRSASLVYRRRLALFRFGGWTYDGKRNEVLSPQGFQVALSQRETSLLKVFLANPHIPLTREEIQASLQEGQTSAPVAGEGEGSGRAIDMLVGRLRSKIESDPKEPQMLRTARGLGYVLAVDVSEGPPE